MAYPDLEGAVNWNTCNGGSPPAVGDSLWLNTGCVLTLDGANASTYTCVKITAAASGTPTTGTNGTIVLANATSTLACNLIPGTVDMIPLTVAANKTYTCTGTMNGGAGTVRCVYVTGGTHVITVNNLTGGASGNSPALRIDSGTITLTFNGTCQATTYAALLVTGGTITYTQAIPACIGSATSASPGADIRVGTPTVTAATGGAVAGAFGVVSQSNGTITVTTAKGGTVVGAIGAVANVGGTVVINGADLSGTGYPASSAGGTLKVAAGVMLAFSDAAGALKKFYGPELLPAVGKVAGVSYGLDADKANYGTTAGTAAGTRVDCPVAKALTTSGNYGDPASPLAGLEVMPDDTDVRVDVPFGDCSGSPEFLGRLHLPHTSENSGDVVHADLVLDTATFGVDSATEGTAAGGGGAALSRVRLGM